MRETDRRRESWKAITRICRPRLIFLDFTCYYARHSHLTLTAYFNSPTLTKIGLPIARGTAFFAKLDLSVQQPSLSFADFHTGIA